MFFCILRKLFSYKKYLRNKLRHDVIPILKQINPQVLHNFQTTISNLQDSQDIIDDAVINVQKKIVEVEEGQIKLNVGKLKKLSNPKAYLYELLSDFNFTAWHDVLHLLNAQSGKQVFSSTHRLLKDRDFLLLTEIDFDSQEIPILIKNEVQEVITAIGTLIFEKLDGISETSKHIIYVDADRLEFPLNIRKWQEGDWFCPLGMTGKKKLSKYFKDEKMSLIDKEKTLILSSADGIVWIMGKRADDRFKITENTTNILKIELQ